MRNIARKGNALTTIILLICVFAILIPAIVVYIHNEAKWSAKERKKTTAFHIAEAGVDRGYWKLIENSTNWNTIINNGTISGYANDVVYSDVSGGYYKINIMRNSSTDVKIVATAKDNSGNEFRAIETIYRKEGVSAAIQAPLISTTGSATIFWGPMMSLGSINMTGSSNQLYPRKYARGSITASGSYTNRDADPNPPNTDNLEWWSYNEPPGVPDIPTPNLDYYRTEAQSQGYYYPTPPATRTISNLVDTVERTRFFEGSVRFTGSKHFRGKLFVVGNCDFSGSADNAGIYTATPPSEAWKQYQKNCPIRVGATDDGVYTDTSNAYGDSAAVDEYPGDGGYHTVEPYTFKTGCVAHNNLSGGPNESVSFKGFIYVVGNIDCTGTTVIHGSIMVATGGSVGTGAFNIFFDENLNIQFSNSSPSKVSWKEITPTPF